MRTCRVAAPLTIIVVGIAIAWARSADADAGRDNDFRAWRDGKAELDGYRYTVTRYGQTRHGQAVMIYVTEPFSRSKSVKVDDHTKNPTDTFEALKLNLVRDFQAGIYDYNTMVSVFTRSDDFSPVKISFSSAEWCGQVYEEIAFGTKELRDRLFSYFEDEFHDRTLVREKNGVAEDALFILLRGLKGPFLSPGGKKSVRLLSSTFTDRLTHRPLHWGNAEIERLAALEAIEVPAGTFSTMVYVVRTGEGREGRFFIEEDHPHRIVRWKWTAAGSGREQEAVEAGELAGSDRLRYWELHDNGHESYLERLGLEPAAGR